MNDNKKTNLIAALIAAAVLLAVASIVVPAAGEIAAGVTVVGALAAMGFVENRKRAY